jgi:glycosyltransferase 2 family protein
MPSKPKKNRVRGLLINAALVAVALGLLGFTVWRNRTDVGKVFSKWPDLRLFAAAFGFYMAGISLSFARWYALVRVIDRRFTLGQAFLLGFIGNVFNLVIPGAVGGDFIKAAYLVRMEINRTQAVASMVIDRIVGLLGLFVLAGIGGVVAWPFAPEKVRFLIALDWAAVLAGFVVLILIFTQALTRAFPNLVTGHSRRAGILSELRVMSSTYRQRLDVVAGALVASVAVHSLMTTAFYLVSCAVFDTALPSFGQHLVIVPLTLFTTAVPLPFGALGVTENVSGQLFGMVRHPNGVLAMLAFRVLMYGGGLVSVGVYLSNLRQVRGLTEIAEELEEELEDNDLDNPPPTD